MNRLTRLLIPTMLGAALVAPLSVEAQHRGAARQTQGSRASSSTGPGGNTTRPGGNTTRPEGNSSRPGGAQGAASGRTPQRYQGSQASRPGISVSNMSGGARPASRPGSASSATKPSGNGHTRPGNQGGNRPATGTRPGGGQTRPGNSNSNSNNNRPGNGGIRPGGGNHVGDHQVNPGVRPGGNPGHNDRPGHGGSVGNHRPDRPGNPGFRPGAGSVPRPGSWSHASRPHYNYRNPGYRPPRPGGGYWGAPPPSPYRINYWVPPVPRYVSVVRTVPTIGTVLGLAFGSFIDAGINALYNAGYTVNGYYNDAIYLSNVRQLGYLWPEAIVLYNDGLMSGTQFYNWSAVPDQNMYYSLYNQLTASYGAPVEISYSNSGPTAAWWGGGNTGYITLSYGYGPSVTGLNSYYTSLTYTAY